MTPASPERPRDGTMDTCEKCGGSIGAESWSCVCAAPTDFATEPAPGPPLETPLCQSRYPSGRTVWYCTLREGHEGACMTEGSSVAWVPRAALPAPETPQCDCAASFLDTTHDPTCPQAAPETPPAPSGVEAARYLRDLASRLLDDPTDAYKEAYEALIAYADEEEAKGDAPTPALPSVPYFAPCRRHGLSDCEDCQNRAGQTPAPPSLVSQVRALLVDAELCYHLEQSQRARARRDGQVQAYRAVLGMLEGEQ
jgi:hypothetical protein